MYLTKLKEIKAVVLDVDGVLTDNSILVTEDGQQLRRFHVKDGYAIQLAVKKGYKICAITGGKSEGIAHRMNHLGVKETFLSVSDKSSVLTDWMLSKKLSPEEVLFIGDDLPDYDVMQQVGLSACPADAAEEIKAIADYVSPLNGGNGMVRELLEKLLKLQGNWAVDSSNGPKSI